MAGKTVLNIEVGDRLTKVCYSARRGKRLRILASFLFPTPDQTVSDGMIVDPKALGDALREQFVLHHTTGARSVTFTLTTSKVASREVLLPPMKPQRMKEVVETNARDYFPVDMSNYQVAFNLLEKVAKPKPGCRVLVIAAPKQLLVGYFRLAEHAGLHLDAVDFSGNSQYQVLRSLPGSRITMYVDVNVGSTTVSFMRGQVLLLQRLLTFGGDELISTVRRLRSDSPSYLDALDIASDEKRLREILSNEDRDEALTRLVTGISRSADYFTSAHTGEVVENVVLMGTCCRLSGLRSLVHAALDRDTALLSEVAGVDFVSNSAEGISAYISCIGSLFQPLNLIPDDMRRRGRAARSGDRKRSDSIAFGVVMLAVCVLAGAGISGMAFLDYGAAALEQTSLQKRMADLSNVNATYETYMKYQEMAGNLTFVDGFAETPNAELTHFLLEMEQKMPASILVLSAVCSPEGITMNITTPGMETAAVVISQLRSFESVASLTVSTITETTDETGFTTASFSISCVYVVQQTTTALSAE